MKDRKTTSMQLLTIVREYIEYERERWKVSLATAYNRIVLESPGFQTWADDGEVVRLRREVEHLMQVNDAMRTRMEELIEKENDDDR